jgi:hypothetical protein
MKRAVGADASSQYPGLLLGAHDMLPGTPNAAPHSSSAVATCKKQPSGCRFIPLRKHSGRESDGCADSTEAGQVSNSEERTRKEFSQVGAVLSL